MALVSQLAAWAPFAVAAAFAAVSPDLLQPSACKAVTSCMYQLAAAVRLYGEMHNKHMP